MAIEAPLSRYKKNNLKIMTVILIGFGLWFYYDGYINQKFIDKHTINGEMDSTLKFNRYGWPVFIAGGIFTGVLFVITRNKKVVADEKQIRAGNKVIAYDSIEAINKTHFDKKGFFTITYNDGGQSRDLTLSERTYDNLSAVLDHTVAKIK
jgi:hypothetical protein